MEVSESDQLVKILKLLGIKQDKQFDFLKYEKDPNLYVTEIIKYYKIKGTGKSHKKINAVKPGHKSVIVKAL